MIWFSGIFVSIAVLKLLVVYLFWESEPKNHQNVFYCSLSPAQTNEQHSSDSVPNTEKDLGQEVALLRRQVEKLTGECAALRRKNADLEQVLAYIREVVFSTSTS